MKANELRIGNKVMYYIGEDGCEWEYATIDEQDIAWAAQKNANFNAVHKPIPLTAEILEKCGFKMSADSSRMFYPRGKGTQPGFEMQLNFISNEWHVYAANYPVTLKGLHQLQNLYFTLTGTELNVNL